MTAFNAILKNEFVIIATDTLSCLPKQSGDTELRPFKFISKTFYLPHFKSMFAITGVAEIGCSLFNLLSFDAYGTNVDSIINIDLLHLKKRWETDFSRYGASNDENIISKLTSTIYLFGFSDSKNRFRGFKTIYDKNSEMTWQEFDGGSILIKPPAKNINNNSAIYENMYTSDYLIKIMKLQKQEDDNNELENKVGIGGEIQISKMNINNDGKLEYNIKNLFRFDDYNETCHKMMYNLNR